jgi:hypothetical protein
VGIPERVLRPLRKMHRPDSFVSALLKEIPGRQGAWGHPGRRHLISARGRACPTGRFCGYRGSLFTRIFQGIRYGLLSAFGAKRIRYAH